MGSVGHMRGRPPLKFFILMFIQLRINQTPPPFFFLNQYFKFSQNLINCPFPGFLSKLTFLAIIIAF
jgi:hypothetical protein